MKNCLKIIKNYLDETDIENNWEYNEVNGQSYISCKFPQFGNLYVGIESPFKTEEILIRTFIVEVTTKDLSLAYSNLNKYNSEYDFLKLVIQTQGNKKYLMAMALLPSLESGVESYFVQYFKKFLENVINLKKNMFYIAFMGKIDEIKDNVLDDDLVEDEWVYDDIFKYSKPELKSFAKDVNVKNVDEKSKSELIESILNTLSKTELIDLCKNNNIVGFSSLGKLDIIKLIIKNKNKF